MFATQNVGLFLVLGKISLLTLGFGLLLNSGTVKAKANINYHYHTSNSSNSRSSSMSARFIPILPLPAEPCQVGANFGTSYTVKACRNRGGTSLGAYTSSTTGATGVCCQFILSCNSATANNRVTQNSTYIISAGDHNNLVCTYTVPQVEGACQVKVELLTFAYAPADEITSICSVDSLVISGSTTVEDGFTICGTSSATLYLSFEAGTDITLTFSTTNPKEHLAQITYISCASNLQAPEHCLQYFEATTGEVTSFSYPISMIAGERYGICIKAPRSATEIQWRECDIGSMKSQFFLSAYFVNNLPATDPLFDQNNMPVAGEICSNTTNVEFNGLGRHCGGRLLPSTDTLFYSTGAKPFMAFVNISTDTALPIANGNLVPFPIVRGSDCDLLGQSPHAQGFDILTDPLSCQPVPPLCMCNPKVDNPPIAIEIQRTGFCLLYTVV